jgi:N-acetylmuramoyl-L-alanine amidase
MPNQKRLYRLLILFLAGISFGLRPPPPNGVRQAEHLLTTELEKSHTVKWVREQEEGKLTVCLIVSEQTLAGERWTGLEKTLEAVRRAMTPISWSSLFVKRWNPEIGRCQPISDFAPASKSEPGLLPRDQVKTSAASLPQQTKTAESFPDSLVGKTVYVSAGHGWLWNGNRWVTQRPPYENIIEDHNNAEAVDQYLIPYLENAGATVISVRERDWNTPRVIVDNDDGEPEFSSSGPWYATSYSGTGYNGTNYHYALTDGPTAVCTWTLTVPERGTYALYAWVRPGTNRAPDAHYTVQHAGGSSDVWVNQQIRKATWRYLGSYPFYSGPATISLDSGSLADGKVVIADAIRLGGGTFHSLDGISDPDFGAGTPPPDKPWWETATYYYSQWMGYEPGDYFNDIVSRPMFARWNHAGSGEDAIYVSWHSNGWTGVTRGTESYVHNGETYSRTSGSHELQRFVHQELIHDLRVGWDSEWIDRGMKQMNLGELRMLYDENRDNQMPGVLLEIAFHDQPEDAAALKNPRFNQLAARAVYQGIVQYFEAKSATDLTLAPEPPTHLRIKNIGDSAVRVSWSDSPVDTLGLGGEIATAYRVYTSTDGFAWKDPVTVVGNDHSITGLTLGSTVYVRVTAINSGGESFPTEVLGVRVGDPRLTIVNGFDKLSNFGLVQDHDPDMGTNERMWVDKMNNSAYTVVHGESIPTSYKFGWDSASNEAVTSDLVDLDNYAVVDWILGEESNEGDGTLSAVARAKIETYLNQGGGLIISGSELAWDLEAKSRDPDFLNTVLRTDFIADDASTLSAVPVSGTAFDGLSPFSFDAPGTYYVDHPDVLAPMNDGSAALYYSGGLGGSAAIQASGTGGGGCERLIVMGFPFEAIESSSRISMMDATLQFLDACKPLGTQITSPLTDYYYRMQPSVAGIAFGDALTKVEVQLLRIQDEAYWNGSQWSLHEAWLNATGTETWSYPVPPLSDGAYTVRARAVGFDFTTEPVEASFTLDTATPLPPTVITPTGGITLPTPSVILQWDLSDENGSPITFEITLDGIVHSTNDTKFNISLHSGLHQWRVRAYDLAGNLGPWTSLHHFYTDPQEIFLPIMLKSSSVNYESISPATGTVK